MLRIKHHPQIVFLIKILFFISFLAFILVSIFPRPLFGQSSREVIILIQNGAYRFNENTLQPDQTITLVIHNLDQVVHGFISPFFDSIDVSVKVGGVTTFSKGVKGVHIKPGKTARIEFAPTLAGAFSFHCDIHPSIKGEMAILTVGAG